MQHTMAPHPQGPRTVCSTQLDDQKAFRLDLKGGSIDVLEGAREASQVLFPGAVQDLGWGTVR